MERQIIKIYLILDIVVLVMSIWLGLKWFISSQIGFFAMFGISYISHKSYQNKIENEIRSGKYDDFMGEENLNDYDEKKPEIRSNFTFTFFSPLKFMAYALFFLTLFMLVKFSFFHPIAIIAGISIVPIGALFYGFLRL